MKIWLVWTLLLALFCQIQGDTKILREVDIFSDNAFRQEILSLRNVDTEDEELVIEGNHSEDILSKVETDFLYRIETIYVADRDGYRAKYKLTREPYAPTILKLNASTLKSLSG